MGNSSTTIFHYIIIRPTLNLSLKHYIYFKKDTKIGSQNFGYQIWFCTRLLKQQWRGALLFLAATKQLYKWYFPSVRLSVCPSVRLFVTPFWLCSHHRIIMKLSEVITNDQRKDHAKGQGQRSKVKVTEVTTQLNRFRTVTPVWIHIW